MKNKIALVFREHPTPVLGILACFVIGLILIVKPAATVQTLINISGWAIILVGLVRVAQYFFTGRRADDMSRLTTGLLILIGGALTLSISRLLIAIVPFLMGFALLGSGVIKFQGALDMRRLARRDWKLALICVGFSVLFGVILLIRPFQAGEAVVRLLGILLVIESIQDVACYIRMKG